jgi:hypothetical protein
MQKAFADDSDAELLNRERHVSRTSLSEYGARILVAADSGESRMTQSVLRRPFQKLDSRHDEWV